jgi:hypothetical protein
LQNSELRSQFIKLLLAGQNMVEWSKFDWALFPNPSFVFESSAILLAIIALLTDFIPVMVANG